MSDGKTTLPIYSGSPILNGVYLCYVEDPDCAEWAAEEIRHWHKDHWLGSPRLPVLAWAGPFPAYKTGETTPKPGPGERPVMQFDL